MALSTYLTPDRTCLLQAATREEAIAELAALLCRQIPGLRCETLRSAVLARDNTLSTLIAPGLALPHARIPNIGQPLIAAGLSHNGIAWGPADKEPTHLILLLIGDEANPREHLDALGDIARTLGDTTLIRDLLDAPSATAVYAALTDTAQRLPISLPRSQTRETEALFRLACTLATDLRANAILVIGRADLRLEGVTIPRMDHVTLLLACDNLEGQAHADDRFQAVYQAPIRGLAHHHGVDLALLVGMSAGHIHKNDVVICLFGPPTAPRLESVTVIHVNEHFQIALSLQDDLVAGDIELPTLVRVLNLAAELAGEGREGKRVGTIFVLGDDATVSAHCRQLVINPLKGYRDDERNILDPSLAETVKEFSNLDGAFIIRGNGVMLSAGTYLQADTAGAELPSGLGARHAAGKAITACTNALAVVISQSSGAITIYHRGNSILSLKRTVRT